MIFVMIFIKLCTLIDGFSLFLNKFFSVHETFIISTLRQSLRDYHEVNAISYYNT